ncbi:MAG: ABC transporter ATP-binding protein [Elusimicrobiaceae bacterium]|jgi:iron complex transport system ATP-binding protein|nr:ABC transporter ATP-binding protein [Elusimicrobiaceae bacterium]MBT3954923.1 ABC transporter ATP-binding protein [Elusimicrobiaceae bacterium]MBT4008573.1 ABC transporter ATP-binding protein [Elusimicrobiaceae bacterium]MBT4402989.1 ABC transporter ATP-binding protein [Elusimicrobiaceae bacterium]MBT4439739.1 ABC transporter ATP-binding protein [Elusimicrobiaceae bacterium]
MINLKNISYKISGKEILQNIFIHTKNGDILGIAGQNGSGKTTLLNASSGFLKNHEGEVLIDGKNIKIYNTKQLALKISYLPAEIYLPYDFTVNQIVLMGRNPHIKAWQDYNKKDFKEVEKAFTVLNISHLKNRVVNNLSSGEKQKVFIAQALCKGSKILLLDEPTSHLDIKNQVEIFKILKTLATKQKITCVIVSHDINLLSKYCHKIAILKEGKLLTIGTPKEVVTEDNIKKAYQIKTEIFTSEKNKPQICIK